MAQITLTIPDPYVDRLTTAIRGIYPMPRIVNPEWEAEPENPTGYDPDTPQYIDQYTSVQWAKIKIKDFLVDTLKRYEQREATRVAKEGVDIPSDLVS